MDITFYYQNNKQNYRQETILTSFAKAISEVIELPSAIEICLYDLGESVYGGIDMYRINRIGINHNLSYDALPKILTHELIHVHQKHTGILKIKRDGSCYWHGILITKQLPEDLSYEDYQNLPWEMDVAQKQHQIFQAALNLTTNRG